MHVLHRFFVTIAVAALPFVASAADAPIVIKFSHVVAADTPKGKAAEMFKRPKMGFSAPIPAWLRGELAEFTADTLLSDASRARGIVDPASVERLIARHNAGEEHTKGLWALLMLELWHREFVDQGSVPETLMAAA